MQMHYTFTRGHPDRKNCIETLVDAFDGAQDDRPALFIAYTVKGYGTPLAGLEGKAFTRISGRNASLWPAFRRNMASLAGLAEPGPPAEAGSGEEDLIRTAAEYSASMEDDGPKAFPPTNDRCHLPEFPCHIGTA